MSGGSYDYCYRRLEQVAEGIRGTNASPLRRAFAEHLRLVAKAMHDIEWVDSCDYGPGDEHEAIRAVLSPGVILTEAIAIAKEARATLDEAIAEAEARRT